MSNIFSSPAILHGFKRQAKSVGVAVVLAASVGLVQQQVNMGWSQAATGLEGNASFQQARQFYDAGNIGEALPLLESLAQQNPDSSQAHLWVAKALMKEGSGDSFQQAKNHLIKSLTINPNEPESLMFLGRIVGWDSSRRDQAIQLHKQALALKESSPVIQDNEIELTRELVQLYMWNGQYIEAAEYAQPIRSAFATEKKWQAVYGSLLSHLGQSKDAIPLYDEYIKPFEQPLSTDVAQWQLDYIYALRYGDQPQKAHTLFSQAEDNVRQLNEPSLNANLASVAYELGEYQTSIELTNSLPADLGQTKDAQLRNARAYMKIQNIQPAIETFYTVYQSGDMTAREKLELADIIIGQQITPNMLPEANLVDTLYGEVANDRVAMEEQDIQLQVARHQASQGGTDNGDVSPQVYQAYALAIQNAGDNYQAPLGELLGYLKSRKGPQADAALMQLVNDYPTEPMVKGAYAEYLSWDESSRTEAIRQYVELAETDVDGRSQWLRKLDEVLGWGSPNAEWSGFYDRIIALDPDHIGATQAKRQLISARQMQANQQPTLRSDQVTIQPTTRQAQQASDPWDVGYANKTYTPPSTDSTSMATMPSVKPSLARTSVHQSDVWGGTQQDNVNGSLRKTPTGQRWNDAPRVDASSISRANPYQYDQPYTSSSSASSASPATSSAATPENLVMTSPSKSPVYNRPFSQAETPTVTPSLASTSVSLKERIEEAKQLSYDRKYSQSFRLFDKVLASDPNNKDALLGKAYALLWSGRKYQAKDMLSKLHHDYPHNLDIITGLADAYKSMGRNDKVIKLMREIRSNRGALPASTVSDYATLSFIPCANESTAPTLLIKGVSVPLSDVTLDTLPSGHAPQQLAYQGPVPTEVQALEDELMSLNAALATLEDVQAESGEKIDQLTEDLWNTRQPFEASSTEFVDQTPQRQVNTQGFLNPSYGQSTAVYNSPVNGNGFGYIPPGQQYQTDNIDRIESDLYNDLRPEFRVGYGFQTQDGERNTNKVSTWGVLNQLSFNLTPNVRVRGGVIPQNFYLPKATVSPDSNFGMLYTVGATAKPFDRLTLDGDFGIANFSQSNKTNVNYRFVASLDPWDRVRVNVGSRRLTLANSLLSIAGFKPNAGAFSGQDLGPAVETSVFTELNLTPFQNVDLNVGYEWAHVGSSGPSPSSYKNQVLASLGYTHRFNDKHWARIGYQFMYMNFSKDTINGYYDVTSFGATQPVVGLNPVTLAANGYEFGGYFSPTNFFLNAARLDYRGSIFDRFIEYKVGGSIGVQSYSHGSGITDSSPSSMALSADAAVRVNFTDWLAGYGRFGFLDSGGTFTRYRAEGGLIIRPYIEALSPLIGDKVPKSNNFRKVDSQFPFKYDIYNHYY